MEGQLCGASIANVTKVGVLTLTFTMLATTMLSCAYVIGAEATTRRLYNENLLNSLVNFAQIQTKTNANLDISIDGVLGADYYLEYYLGLPASTNTTMPDLLDFTQAWDQNQNAGIETKAYGWFSA